MLCMESSVLPGVSTPQRADDCHLAEWRSMYVCGILYFSNPCEWKAAVGAAVSFPIGNRFIDCLKGKTIS